MADAGSINGLSKQFFDRLKNQKPSPTNGAQPKTNPLQVDGDVFAAGQNLQPAQVSVYSQSGLVRNNNASNTANLKTTDSAKTEEDDGEIDDLALAIRENNQLAAAQGTGLNFDKVLSLLAD